MKLNLPKFIFINGPAGSGKSTLAEQITSLHPECFRESFAEPIRSMIYSVFFPSDGPLEYRYNLREQKIKSSRLATLAGLDIEAGDNPSTREVMIEFSESFMKRLFGPDIFGRLLWQRCAEQTHFYESFVVDDSGFVDEAAYVIGRVGKDNCHLVRLHRTGTHYRGDSRGYISLEGVQTLDLHNDGSPELMLQTLAIELGTRELKAL